MKSLAKRQTDGNLELVFGYFLARSGEELESGIALYGFKFTAPEAGLVSTHPPKTSNRSA